MTTAARRPARTILSHLLITLFLAAATLAQSPSGIMAPVLTRAFDNSRTGLNPHETTFTQSSVRSKGIRKLFTFQMPGDARGTESQPLILSSLKVSDGTSHDVVVLSAMDDTVWAFDANTGAQLWHRKLGIPVTGSRAIDMHGINDHWGILSTGVIDPATATWYGVALTSPDGSPQRGSHAVYALDLRTGQLAAPPAPLAGETYQPARGPLQRWSAAMRKQRSSLVMTDIGGRKTIFFGSGTVLETTAGAAGWVFAYDVATHRITASIALSAGYGAGLWMAGQGLAADSNGDLLGVTGNGSFDPAAGDFGESAIKLQYTPPTTPTGKGKLAVVDNWTPYTDAGRMGEKVTQSMPALILKNKLSGVSAPTEAAKPVNSAHMPEAMHADGSDRDDASEPTNANQHYRLQPTPGKPHAMRITAPNAISPAFADEDWGAGGGFLISKYGIYGASGKDGILYLMHSANLGHTLPADFANAKANYAKLIQYPQWFTYYDPQVDPAPQDPTTLDILPDGKTRHDHSTPVQFESQKWGTMLFCWGENSSLRAWSVDATGVHFLAQGNEVASVNNTNPPGGMPGGFMSLSSNNNAPGTAVLWATIPYGDANATLTNGRLLAYDPENFTTNPDGSRTIQKLWDSEQWGIQFVFNKFNPPIVSGGKLFVPNYAGGVDVYGLAQ